MGIILLMSIAVNFYNNSSSGILGKDESLYIFLAKGHNSNTPIDAPTGSGLDAMRQGVQRTTDPPGIFLLLHIWEKVSYSEAWLRFLPLLFFIISIVTLIKIGLLFKFPLLVSVCLGFLPLASDRMVLHSLEIRAYGMEICITYLMIFFALKIIFKINELNKPNKYNWIFFTLAIVVGLSSRFSFVISAFSIYLILWLIIILRRNYNYFKDNCLSLGISSIISLVFFAIFFRMKPYMETNTASNSVSVDFYNYHISDNWFSVFEYFLKQITLIPVALYSGSGIQSTSFYYILWLLFFCLICIGTISAYKVHRNIKLSELRTNFIIYCGVFLYPLLTIFISCGLAIPAIHPFSINSRYSLYLQPSIHLLIVGFGFLIASQIPTNQPKAHNLFSKYYGIIFTYTLVIIALIYSFHFMFYNLTFRMGGAQHTTHVLHKLINDNELKDIDYWYISLGEIESFKYHVLYGGLKDKLGPDAKIVFENRPITVNEIDSRELESIYNEAKKGSKVVMLLGHVDKKEAEIYRKIFNRIFPDVKYGEYETSSEQIGIAVR